MKVFIREGLYSPEEIADLLLLSVWVPPHAWKPGEDRRARLRARKVLLNLPQHPKPRTSEETMYWMAYLYQQKARAEGKRCSDLTALRKMWGGASRSLWDKLKGQPLEQAVPRQLVKTPT